MVVNNIAIIGAGWSGLQIATVLIECGYKVSLFEELDDVGGTWHPVNAYYGLTTHLPIYACEFYNYPYPKHHDKLKKLHAADVFEYTKSYAKSHDLYNHIQFNTIVTQLHYHTDAANCTITCVDTSNGKIQELQFDFVISTHFNSPRIPYLSGQEHFTGKIYHSNFVKEQLFNEIVDSNVNVVLLGGGKAATDVATIFSRRNYEFEWVMKEMYWFFNYDKLFRCTKTGKEPSRFFSYMYILTSTLIVNDNNSISKIGYILRWLCGLIKCPGKIHFNFNKFHGGTLDQHQFDSVLALNNKHYVKNFELNKRTIKLNSGAVIDCDVLICATGCDTFPRDFKIFKDYVEIKYEDIDKIYRCSVLPEIPLLYFTGLTQLTFTGPMNPYNRAACILKYINDISSAANLNTITKELQISATNGPIESFLFDSSRSTLYVMKKNLFNVMQDLITQKDLLSFAISFLIKRKSLPYKKAEQYIKSLQVNK